MLIVVTHPHIFLGMKRTERRLDAICFFINKFWFVDLIYYWRVNEIKTFKIDCVAKILSNVIKLLIFLFKSWEIGAHTSIGKWLKQ